MDAEKLRAVIESHEKWLRGEDGEQRADLSEADLRRANLRGANLRWADLSWANLREADLRGADLRGANLRWADLSWANLRRANLSEADLRWAYLRWADLSWADLSEADLRGADLRGANLSRADLRWADAPIVPAIDAAILAAISRDGCALDMATWHRCDTTHCRAGWAIHLAGEAGYALEGKCGASVAGALIYAASRPGKPVPDFHASNADALEDIKRCATEQAGAIHTGA